MSDLIDREAVIEAIEGTDWYHQNRNKDMVSGANDDEHQAWYKADDIYKALESIPSATPKGMTKEIHDINTRALDFVVELIDYIFDYPDDDYMTMECLCRKLVKHGFLDKADGYYQTHETRTNTHECVKDTHDKDEPQTEDEILREQCRAFMGIVEQTERSK